MNYFKGFKFFIFITDTIILFWMIVLGKGDLLLNYFVLFSLIIVSLVEIYLSFLKGKENKIYYFSFMSLFSLFVALFFLFIFPFFVKFNIRLDFYGLNFNLFLKLFLLIVILIYFIKSFNVDISKRRKIQIKPYTIISISFLVLVFTGSLLLYMPFSNNIKMSYLDALFTSASAVCVTGLSVIDVGKDLTLFGKIVLICFVQLGGLGLMVFTAFFSYLIGQKLSVFDRLTLKNALSADNISVMYKFISFILLVTLLFEGIGAVIFFTEFKKFLPLSKAIFYSIFHAISAFCNAGFALFPDSFMSFKTNFVININLMFLIFVGGIGFPVLYNIFNIIRRREKRLNLHTKLVLTTTFVLIFFGALIIFLMEYDNAFKDLNFFGKVLASFFASITPRTAGFNTIDYGIVRDSTILFTCILMFIGASPGSTGGGIKTTSFAVILFNTINVLRDKKVVNLFQREISFDSIRKSLVVFILSLNLVLLQTILISFIEARFSLKQVVFEVVSAFGTVGLSTGITPKLSALSKILLISTMFLGRVGTITVIFSLGMTTKKILQRLPEESVLTG
ncbi:MAG: TrkH family potassium uptake protein [Brevinematales bacterium]|nr:TrkH family potassium uptake protein [Brevinematales bacterium]